MHRYSNYQLRQSATRGINPAINQIFGKTLIVHHLIGGSKFARKHNFDCVNMEGDQVLRGGIIKGVIKIHQEVHLIIKAKL